MMIITIIKAVLRSSLVLPSVVDRDQHTGLGGELPRPPGDSQGD